MEIQLQTPATLGERTITSLTLKRPKVKDFLRTDGRETTSVAADVALLSSLSSEPESLIAEIDNADWADIRVVLAGIWQEFFGIKKKEEQAAETKNL